MLHWSRCKARCASPESQRDPGYLLCTAVEDLGEVERPGMSSRTSTYWCCAGSAFSMEEKESPGSLHDEAHLKRKEWGEEGIEQS